MYSYMSDDILIKGISLGELDFQNVEKKKKLDFNVIEAALEVNPLNVFEVPKKRMQELFDNKSFEIKDILEDFKENSVNKLKLLMEFSEVTKVDVFNAVLNSYNNHCSTTMSEMFDIIYAYDKRFFSLEVTKELVVFLQGNVSNVYVVQIIKRYMRLKSLKDDATLMAIEFLANEDIDDSTIDRVILNDPEKFKEFLEFYANYFTDPFYLQQQLVSLAYQLSDSKNPEPLLNMLLQKIGEANNVKKSLIIDMSYFTELIRGENEWNLFELFVRMLNENNIDFTIGEFEIGRLIFSKSKNYNDEVMALLMNNSNVLLYIAGFTEYMKLSKSEYKILKSLFSMIVVSKKNVSMIKGSFVELGDSYSYSFAKISSKSKTLVEDVQAELNKFIAKL